MRIGMVATYLWDGDAMTQKVRCRIMFLKSIKCLSCCPGCPPLYLTPRTEPSPPDVTWPGRDTNLDPTLCSYWLGLGQLLYQLQQTSSSEEFSLWSLNTGHLTEDQRYSLVAGIRICLKYCVISEMQGSSPFPPNIHRLGDCYLCIHISLVARSVSDIVRAQKIAVNVWMNVKR